MNKIQVCFITPTQYLDRYASRSDIHMSLAHLVLDDDKYANFYRAEGEAGKFIIMDNSAFELEEQGRGVAVDSIIEAAKKVGADEIVVPDILFDAEATIDSAKDFMSYIKKNHSDMLGYVKFMAVPQANNRKDWWHCYNELLDMPDITTIGLSKLSIPESFMGNHTEPLNVFKSRGHVVHQIITDNNMPSKFGKETHLLGSDNGGIFELWLYYYLKANEWIRSNDTSMPFVYGLHNFEINEGTQMVQDIIMEKLDFGYNRELSISQVQAIDHNFKMWEEIKCQ